MEAYNHTSITTKKMPKPDCPPLLSYSPVPLHPQVLKENKCTVVYFGNKRPMDIGTCVFWGVRHYGRGWNTKETRIDILLYLPQQPQRAPETAGWASECWHRCQRASSRSLDDCDTSLWHSPAGQPNGPQMSGYIRTRPIKTASK